MYKKDTQNKTVCFFDSGIGGLNLLYRYKKRHENFDFVYVADNYNVPYGNRSHEEILSLVKEKFSLIRAMEPSAAVIACNTVTAECIDALRADCPFPVIGIQPAIKPAAAVSANCVVLATPATAASSSVQSLIKKFGRGVTKVVACPGLAYEIEKDIFSLDGDKITSLLPKTGCDSVVLGCTHYIYASEIIQKFYNCTVYDGIEGTMNRIDELLKVGRFTCGSNGSVSFYGGDITKNFRIFGYLCGQNGP